MKSLAKYKKSGRKKIDHQYAARKHIYDIVDLPFEKEYEIESIITHEKRKGKSFYFVKWAGYSECSWVNEDDMGNAQKALGKYWKE